MFIQTLGPKEKVVKITILQFYKQSIDLTSSVPGSTLASTSSLNRCSSLWQLWSAKLGLIPKNLQCRHLIFLHPNWSLTTCSMLATVSIMMASTGCLYKLSRRNLMWGPLKCSKSNFNPVHVFLHFNSFCLVVLKLNLA